MRRWKKWVLIVAGAGIAAVVLFILSGYLLPADIELETERELDAPQTDIYALMSTYEGIERWSTQAASDMGESYEIHHLGGPTSGVGLEIGYGPKDAPLETWTLIAVDPPRSVTIEVDFQLFVSTRTLELRPSGSKILARWTETAHIDNPLMRWMLKFSTAGAIENRNTVLNAAGTVAGAQEASPPAE